MTITKPNASPTGRRGSWLGAASAALLAAVGGASADPAGAVPPLDREALRRAMDELPGGEVTGALIRVAGADGHWWGASGVADRGTGEPVRSGAPFRIGGLTRLFTGTVLLRLAVEHRADPAAAGALLHQATDFPAAAAFIEETTGRSCAQEIRSRVIKPLGLGGTAAPEDWARGGMVSTAADLDRLVTGLLGGRLLPPEQQDALFERLVLPGGTEIRGVTAAGAGHAHGVFATRDLSRRLVCSLNLAEPAGEAGPPHLSRMATAAFGRR